MDDHQHRPTVDLRKGDTAPAAPAAPPPVPPSPGGTWAPGPAPTLGSAGGSAAGSAGGSAAGGPVEPPGDARPDWSAGGAPPPIPVGHPPRRRNVPVLVAAGVVALLVLAGIVAFVATGGSDSDDRPAAADSPSPVASTAPLSTPVEDEVSSDAVGEPLIPDYTNEPTSTEPSSTEPSAEPSSAEPTEAESTDPGEQYSGPGGLSVTGPSGWVVDYSANVPTIADYIPPDSSERRAGPSLRIGIGNDRPSGSFGAEIGQAEKFLRSRYDARIIGPSQYSSFLGATSADVQYIYDVDDLGVTRRGIERLWRSGGVTMIIQSSGLAEDWPETLARFRRLTASAELS